jgi:hypothetical protein
VFGVTFVQAGDHVGGNGERVAQLEGVIDGAGGIFDHDGSFDGGFGAGADGEDAVVLHQDGKAVADGTQDFLADALSPMRRSRLGICRELVADGGQHRRMGRPTAARRWQR